MIFRISALLPLLLLSLTGCGIGGGFEISYVDPTELPDSWRTKAERTAYTETSRYDECVDFCKRLAAASPYAHYTSFGLSGEGRELPLLILSENRAFSAEKAHANGKLVVLVESCIHSGECCGKDASLELARDILITGQKRDLLKHVNLLLMPIFSTDGHERFGPYNRINQNGPREMGWRVTAHNLNLNRDFTKADADEMQHWLKAWNSWQPDMYFDIHATNGSDHQYILFYAGTTGQLVAEPIADWMNNTLLATILPQLKADGQMPFPYGGPRDLHDLTKGISTWATPTPRFSNGFGAVCNRPTILVETHAHKSYRQRVRAAYAIVQRALEEINRNPAALREAIYEADKHAIERRGTRGDTGEVVLRLEDTEESEPVTYRAVEYSFRPSAITGGEIVEYSDRPLDVETQLFRSTRVAESVVPPAAYVIPLQWLEVIARLDWHGIEYFRLERATTLAIDSYRFEDVTFPERPFEGRFSPSFKTLAIHESRTYLPGTVVVPLNQRRAKLVVHLLEPAAPDSLLRWGLLNNIFEKKEYASDFKLEPIAQRMLAADSELKREFEQRLRDDEEFAGDTWARLNFFYRRSPYWDQLHNVYPIARLMDQAVLEGLRANAK